MLLMFKRIEVGRSPVNHSVQRPKSSEAKGGAHPVTKSSVSYRTAISIHNIDSLELIFDQIRVASA